MPVNIRGASRKRGWKCPKYLLMCEVVEVFADVRLCTPRFDPDRTPCVTTLPSGNEVGGVCISQQCVALSSPRSSVASSTARPLTLRPDPTGVSCVSWHAGTWGAMSNPAYSQGRCLVHRTRLVTCLSVSGCCDVRRKLQSLTRPANPF